MAGKAKDLSLSIGPQNLGGIKGATLGTRKPVPALFGQNPHMDDEIRPWFARKGTRSGFRSPRIGGAWQGIFDDHAKSASD